MTEVEDDRVALTERVMADLRERWTSFKVMDDPKPGDALPPADVVTPRQIAARIRQVLDGLAAASGVNAPPVTPEAEFDPVDKTITISFRDSAGNLIRSERELRMLCGLPTDEPVIQRIVGLVL